MILRYIREHAVPGSFLVSSPSNWPLPAEGKRFLTPASTLRQLRDHPLARGCYPVAMGFYPSAAGHEMARDRHDDHLLIFCSAGRGELLSPGGGAAVRAGDVLLLPRGEAHSYRALAEDPWTLYWVHFNGEEAAAFARYVRGDAGPVLHSGVEPAVLSGFEALLAAATRDYRLNSYITASNRLRQLLTEIAQYCERSPSARLGRVDFVSLQRFMRERIGGQLTLRELADLARLSPQHFANRYRERTGIAPLQHFQQMKIQAACRLLDSTDDSIKVIAARLGYHDPLYFSRAFRRTQGISPRDYRESQRR